MTDTLCMSTCSDSSDKKDDKKFPVRGEKPRDGKPEKKTPEEEGVDSANDFMKKFLERSDEN